MLSFLFFFLQKIFPYDMCARYLVSCFLNRGIFVNFSLVEINAFTAR